jgi:hypothetical protein
MTRVMIVVDEAALGAAYADLACEALQQAAGPTVEIAIQTTAALQLLVTAGKFNWADWQIWPFTLDWPFDDQGIYQACRNVTHLRQVAAQFQVLMGDGDYWLPIVHTAKGTLYAEAIWRNPAHPELDQAYCQPLHLEDAQRQPLYRLGQQLIQHLAAPPAVYLMQFGVTAEGIIFDRLFPFPAAPAIASVGIQMPDLFACYWACRNHLPILDITIKPPVNYQRVTA